MTEGNEEKSGAQTMKMAKRPKSSTAIDLKYGQSKEEREEDEDNNGLCYTRNDLMPMSNIELLKIQD